MDEIIEVLRLFNFPNDKWFVFGMKLGLLHPTLKEIEANFGKDVAKCLMECLSLWLTTKADSATLTWQTLAGALRRIEKIAVAEKIQKTSNYLSV